MKFVTERKELLKALVQASGVVERSNTVPVLANVLLEAGDGVVKITATDLDMQFRTSVRAEIEAAGKTTVSAGMLTDIVKKAADGSQISCEMVDGQFVVKSGRARMKLFCLPAEDFPAFGLDKPEAEFKIEASVLVPLIRKAGFAVSTDQTRYYLNGIYMHWRPEDDTVAFVGTDGHRLSLAWIKAPEGASKIPGIIVPKKTAQLVAKHVDGGGEIEVRVSSSKIVFLWGNSVLASKLIDGSFPDYWRVIPQGNANRLEGAAKAIADSVDRVTTVATDAGRGIRFSFDPNDAHKPLVVSVANTTGGEGEDAVKECNYTGAQIEIGFNARYVLDAIAGLDAETLIWELGDAGSPAIMRSAVEGARHIAVVMPMRV